MSSRDALLKAWENRRSKYLLQADQVHKVCGLCGKEKPIHEFSSKKSHYKKADGTHSIVVNKWCKLCHSTYYSQWRNAGGQEKINKNVSLWYRRGENSLKQAEQRKRWREENKEQSRILSLRHSWRRHKRVRMATPQWADFNDIERVYEEARRISASTGIPHQVDHVIPLKSKFVCGLHIHANLQILPASENARKKNTFVELRV